MIEAVLVLGILNVVIGLISIWQRHQAIAANGLPQRPLPVVTIP